MGAGVKLLPALWRSALPTALPEASTALAAARLVEPLLCAAQPQPVSPCNIADRWRTFLRGYVGERWKAKMMSLPACSLVWRIFCAASPRLRPRGH